jgi:hypothetical protein
MAEVLVATAIAGVILAGAVYMFGQSVDVSTITTLRGDMQQNARVAINLIYRDLLVAGTGLPSGGVQLPYVAGNNTTLPVLGCAMSANPPCFVIPGGLSPAGSSVAMNYTQTINGTINNWMYWINPQDGCNASAQATCTGNATTGGPTVSLAGNSMDRDPWNTTQVNLVPTDVVTIVYKDNNYPVNWPITSGATPSAAGPLDQYSLCAINFAATPITVVFDSRTDPPPTDAAYGLNVGDVLFFNNSNGTAVGTVTNVITGGTCSDGVTAGSATVTLDTNGDVLNFNNPMFPASGTPNGVGGLSSIQTLCQTSSVPPCTPVGSPLSPPVYPATSAFRLIVVTYFIDNYTFSYPRLMRQVNALTPTPVAQYIENLQLSYDIFDPTTNTVCPDVANMYTIPNSCSATTAYSPNQIGKVNIFVQARSSNQRLVNRGYSRVSMISAVTPRNLDFVDRY